MRPTDEEIDRKVKFFKAKQKKLYMLYRIKSFLGIPTKGIHENNSLIFRSILEANKNPCCPFSIINNIENIEPQYLQGLHRNALILDENDHVTVFFNAQENIGDFIIGESVSKKLGSEYVENLRSRFMQQVNAQKYFKATEDLIKSINWKMQGR